MNLNSRFLIGFLATAWVVSCHQERVGGESSEAKGQTLLSIKGPPASEGGTLAKPTQASTESGSVTDGRSEELKKRLAEFRTQILVPFAEVGSDEAKARLQAYALGQLSQMQSPEAAAILAELLFMPVETYFYENLVTKEHRGYSYSMQCMDSLALMLENTPKPLDGHTYRTADIPVWREWWNANKDHLRFRDWHSKQPSK